MNKTIQFSITLPETSILAYALARGYNETIGGQIPNPQTSAEYVANYAKALIDNDIESYQLLAVEAQFEVMRQQVRAGVAQLITTTIS